MPRRSRRALFHRAAGFLAGPALGNLAYGRQTTATVKPPRIKIGQIGVGHGHASKLSVYRRSEDYEVVGLVEPDDGLRQGGEVEGSLPGPSVDDPRAVSQRAGTPGRAGGDPGARLARHGRGLRSAGLHVHLDKPAGESLAQYRRILEAASRTSLWVQMGYMYRYNPAVALLRDGLRRGWLGDVFEVHAVMSKVVERDERAVLAQYRGGIMFELGCHVIDLVVGVLGAPKKVTAHVRHSSKLDDTLVDNMLAVFDYPVATATVRSSALEVDGFERRHLVVCGTEGTFHIQPLDNPSARVAFSTVRGLYRKGYQELSFPKFTRYVADAADMARVIRGEKAIDFTPQHDLAVQKAVLQASGLPADS